MPGKPMQISLKINFIIRFYTAHTIRPKFLRDLCSILFTLFYLVSPENADEKVRKFRALSTPELMRISWEKSTTPLLRLLTTLDRGRLSIRQNISISRPKYPLPSSFHESQLKPIEARLYFSGTPEQLFSCSEFIFHCPGGGFVCMSPLNHDDYVSAWARKTGLPIVSINYGKAPEYPYPWAIEECFAAYVSVIESFGAVIGLSGAQRKLKVVLAGDSA